MSDTRDQKAGTIPLLAYDSAQGVVSVGPKGAAEG